MPGRLAQYRDLAAGQVDEGVAQLKLIFRRFEHHPAEVIHNRRVLPEHASNRFVARRRDVLGRSVRRHRGDGLGEVVE
jgi:hypothetical protein